MQESTGSSAKSISKKTSNYIRIKFGWSEEIVVPYKAGVAFMESLELAEKINNERVTPEDIQITTKIISHQQYTDMKKSYLLGATVDTITKG